MNGYIEMENDLIRTLANLSREELAKSCEYLTNQTVDLTNRLHKSNDEANDLRLKIEGVQDFILDYISINDNLDNDELREIADILKMKLTKIVDIEYTVKYTGLAEIPLDVDVDDIDWEDEVSFHVDTNSEHHIDLSADSVEVDVREMN